MPPIPPTVPLSRRLQHPGPPVARRLQSCEGPQALQLRLQLSPGLSLHEAVVRPLVARGVRSAALSLLGGWFSALQYCVGPATPEGPAVAAYAPPAVAGAGCLIAGEATLGLDLGGEPMVHCHAMLRDGQGALCGGHLMTRHCVIGDAPITARVTVFEHFDLHLSADAETAVSLFLPEYLPEVAQP